MNDVNKRNDIAVIGIGLDIHDAKTLSDYWQIFDNQLDSIRDISENRKEQIADYARLFLDEGKQAVYYRGTYLERIDEFDNDFFRISPKEAQAMDPVQRIMLQVIFSAFDDACYTPDRLNGSKTGIYLGYTANSLKDNYLTNIAFRYREYMKYALVGNMAAMIPARASHILNLQGPAMVIDTACSSSLVAIHEASEAIRNGMCEMAIAGGIKLNMMPLILEEMQIGIEAGDDKTRTFDDFASGASIGEGFACVMLKSLREAERDGDHIYAVIRGSAVNHDGNASSITAPNPKSQKKVILEAMKRAGVSPEDIGYIETHGTGTILGDPIEFQGMTQAFEEYTDRKQFCALSSAKGYIGHLYECAGIASFIKAVAALYYQKIPGMRHFTLPNQKIDVCDSPFYINLQTCHWRTNKPRICGISAFGLSGTNCHMILQEYPSRTEPVIPPASVEILTVSAKSLDCLRELLQQYRTQIKECPDPIRFIRCLNAFRSYHAIRLAIVFRSIEDVLNTIDKVLRYSEEDWTELDYVYFSDPKKKDYFISRDELREATERAKNFFRDGADNEAALSDTLDRIAKAYVLGNSIDWDTLYESTPLKSMPLPVYPYAKKRHWLPQKAISFQPDKQPMAESENVPKEIPWFYERTFIPDDVLYSQSECGKCLMIRLGKDDVLDLYSQLNSAFTECQIVDVDIEEALHAGAENYFTNKYGELSFRGITHIIVTGPICEEEGYSVQNRTLLNLFSIICLYRVLFKKAAEVQIYILLDNFFAITGEESLCPDSAAVYGLCKSFNREFKQIRSCCIEWDRKTDIKTVVNEITRTIGRDIVLFRGNTRYVEGIQEKDLKQKEAPVLRKDGVYVFSGGLGGVAYETAQEFARQSPNSTLILLGRRPEPLESETMGKEDEERLRRLQNLKRAARCVNYIPCDVTDRESVARMVDEVTSMYGKINGVIHAAGIGGGISVDQLDTDRVLRIIAPKIVGTYNLDQETRHQPLDFFVMFSSIATVFSSSDLADYAAGNLYMDAYCQYRAAVCSGSSITVNWATWSETGMSVNNNFTIDTIFKSLRTEDGVHGLQRVLSNGSGNTIIGKMNLDNKISLLLRTYPVALSSYLENALNALENSSDNTISANERVGIDYEQYNNTEKEIMRVCSRHLGYDNINLQDNFFELGADSILLGMIYRDLDAIYPKMLQVTDLFTYPTVGLLADYLAKLLPDETVPLKDRNDPVDDEAMIVEPDMEDIEDGIAIIGIGINLPNADSLEKYWELLSNGISTVREMPEERGKDIRRHLRYKGMPEEEIVFRNCGYLDSINQFDYSYFNMSPKEASLIDPVNRMFLECCAKAIDDSGYGKDGVKGSSTGVFLGYTSSVGNAYSRLIYELDPHMFAESLAVSQPSMAASRVAYVYDLKGPSMVLDTACSSTHVAIHMACEQIRMGRCRMALAGGASVTQTPFAEGFSVGFESEEYITRTFSEQSTGSAIAEGVGVLLLKGVKEAIKDGDPIYAVIKGTAINQDGSSFGIAAPNYLAQAEVIQEAWKSAGITADDVSYIEAHGTGTQLGDPIEVNGITTAFRTQTEARQICGIGSVKTNMGHANEASGICGIVKSILILNKGVIPPSLNFNVPNMNIDFINSPLYVVNRLTPLKTKRGRTYIGSSGFGMSGTNGHIVLTQAPVQTASTLGNNDPIIFAASAKSPSALKNLIKQYEEYLQKNPDVSIRDFCHTATAGRGHFSYRLAFSVANREDLLSKLRYLANTENIQENEWLHQGHYAVVPTSKKERLCYEITRNELKKYTAEASELLQGRDRFTKRQVEKILTLYIKGADVQWKDFYSDTYIRLHIPGYPFERQYCWYPIPELCNENETPENGYFYESVWVRKEGIETCYPADDESVMVFITGEEEKYLVTALIAVCKRVIPVYRSNNNGVQEQEGNFYIDGTTESYINLFSCVKNRNIVRLVYFASTNEDSEIEANSVCRQLDRTFFDVINLIKGMGKSHIDGNIELTIITNQVHNITGIEKDLYPQNAPVLSLVKVIEQEYPNIVCKGLDIDGQTSSDILVREIFSTSREYITGIRNGSCYIQESREALLEPSVDSRIVEGGVYLITGGTSGIGLALAEYISTQNKCVLILASRSGFLSQDQWDDERLKEYEREKIRVLTRIKENGCILNIIQCDIADEEDVKSSIEMIHQKYGRISGVIHSAGISGAGYILRKEKESFLQVLAPKVKGTLNLAHYTRGDKLDFMVLCSSAVTDSGEAGQSDYVGANSFLDAFTEYQNANGYPTYTVNWVSWRETGMAVRYGINVDTITKALTTSEAVEAFHKFLCSSPGRVLIGQYNLTEQLLTLYQYSRNRISESLINKLTLLVKREQEIGSNSDANGTDFAQIRNGTLTYIPKSDRAINVKAISTTVKLEGDPQNEYTRTEKDVADIYSYILGYECLNVYDNFFEMGGDSVMLTKMHDRLEEKYPGLLKVADLFDYVSIRGLAAFIDERGAKRKEDKSRQEDEKGKNRDIGINEPSYFPMSYPQQRVYYDYRIAIDKHIYNIPFVSDVTGMSEKEIREVMERIVEKHDMLRSCFILHEMKLMRCVYPYISIDFTKISAEEEPLDFSHYLTQFDLAQAPLFHLTLITHRNKQWLLFDVHHILLDGYSSSLLQEEMRLISGKSESENVFYQYDRYTDFEKQYYPSEEYQAIRAYWKTRLSDAEFCNPFNPDKADEKLAYGNLQAALPEETSSIVAAYARKNQTTQYSVLLASLYLALYTATGKTDFIVITSVLNRHEAVFSHILGLFTNLLPLRCRINKQDTLQSFMEGIIENLHMDLQNQYYQYHHLIQDFRKHHPAFYIYLDFEDESLKKNQDMEDIAVNTKIAKYDLHVDLKRRNRVLDIEWNYFSHLYSEEYMGKLLGIFIQCVRYISLGHYNEMTVEKLSRKIQAETDAFSV